LQIEGSDMATEASSKSLTRWILPIALFVLIIGGVAWLSQNLPRGPAAAIPKSPPGPDPVESPALKFLLTRAVWDAADPNYVKESETGVEGYYDFPFINPEAMPIALGFAKSLCDCSHLRVFVLDKDSADSIKERHAKNPTQFPSDSSWTWTMLAPADKDGVQIPPGRGGVARIQWDGRKGAGQRPNLKIKVWMHPVGKPEERSFLDLEAPIVMSDPLRFSTDRLKLDTLGPGGQVRRLFQRFDRKNRRHGRARAFQEAVQGDDGASRTKTSAGSVRRLNGIHSRDALPFRVPHPSHGRRAKRWPAARPRPVHPRTAGRRPGDR
jgi:hypothetical protein